MKNIRWLIIFLLIVLFAMQGLKRHRISYPHTSTRLVAETSKPARQSETPALETVLPTITVTPALTSHENQLSISDKLVQLESALLSEETQAQANQSLAEMVTTGSRGEVAALLLRFDKLPDFAKETIVKEQATLCRFQDSSEQPSFDWLKAKLAIAAEGKIAIQSWSDICKG